MKYLYLDRKTKAAATFSQHHSFEESSLPPHSQLPPPLQALPSQSASLDRHCAATAGVYPEQSPAAYDTYPPHSNYTTPSGSSSTRSSISQPYFSFQQQHLHNTFEHSQQHYGTRKIYSSTVTPRSPTGFLSQQSPHHYNHHSITAA
uniref:Uncharacterized protein n=1 Tax=Panagrolaimus sp. PS1159 TaxID=55785 RepID=A0AC35GC08_9BILA